MTSESKTYFYDKKMETMSSSERKEYQENILRKLIPYAFENSKPMRNKFIQSGISPNDISNIENLKKLPLTRKSELIEAQKKNPPFGDFVVVTTDKLKRICVSPGPIFDARPRDPTILSTRIKLLYTAGFRPGDIVVNCFSYHYTPAGTNWDDALTNAGCVVVPAGPGNTEQLIPVLHRLRVKGYIGTPSFLPIIADKAIAAGLDLKKDLNLKVGFCTAERLPESLRKEVEEKFGMTIRQSYGTADTGILAYECSELTGMHVPEEIFIEILDPKTGENLPSGECGEVVVSVFNEMMPLVRFSTGDLSIVDDTPCPCGRTSPRLKGIFGRVDQAIKVRGMFVYVNNIKEVLNRFSNLGEFYLVVDQKNYRDELIIYVEKQEDAEDKKLIDKIENDLKEKIKVSLVVRFIPSGSIEKNTPKILDKRQNMKK